MDQEQLSMDALLVANNGLSDIQLKINSFASILENEKAKKYFIYGLLRRLQIIQTGMRYFVFTLPANREKPLQHDEINDAILHINSFYVHLYGALDNLAWTIAYEVIYSERDNLENDSQIRRKISLFHKDFIEKIKNDPFSNYLKGQEKWYLELSEKRHPSAHRIPFYVPPTALNEKQSQEYVKLINSAIEEIANKNFEEVDKNFNSAENLGYFVPCFGHDGNGFFPLYPTITDDCKKLICILDKGMEFLKSLFK